MVKIILFVDALEPREIGNTRLEETQRGLVDSGAPKVTPKVTSEVYTGQPPSVTGMGQQHSINGDRIPRPVSPTIMEKLDRAGYNVLSLYMPYCHPLQIESQAFVSDTMQGPQPGQSPLSQMLVQPPTPGDLMDPDDDGELAYNARTDEIYARSSSMLNAIRAGDFDVVFLGIRSPDQYTHFQWHEHYRRQLLEDIAHEIERWEVNHDVLWWCYDEETEVLTENGWRYFSELDGNERLMTLDPDSHEAEWQTPHAVTSFDAPGKMYRLETQQVDLKVTPNHRLYQRCPRTNAGTPGPWEKKEAYALKGGNMEFKKDAEWSGTTYESVRLPPLAEPGYDAVAGCPPEAFFKLLGYWVGDGTLHHGDEGNYEVMIRQDSEANSKPHAEIVSLFEACGFNPQVQDDRVKVYSKHLHKWLADWWKPKRIPAMVKEAASKHIEQFLSGLVASDGTVDPTGTRTIYTTSHRLAGDVQEVAMKAGMAANIREEKQSPSEIDGRTIESEKPHYRVTLMEETTPAITLQTRVSDTYTEEYVEYDGQVYCASVPNGVLYVRRGGKPVWCGNSDHGSEEKKDTFRVNKWLEEKGYLDLDIDLEFNERFTEEAQGMQPNGGDPSRVENQLAVHSPGVEMLDGTKAVSADPYDSSIDIVDDDLDPQTLAADLESTGYYDRVVPTEEEWGDGSHIDKSPDLVALRADNILVTGNVHPDPIGMGFYRTGVHSKYGAWGTTDDTFGGEGTVTPAELHDVIWSFVTGQPTPEQAEISAELDRVEQQMSAMLGDD